MNRLFKVFIILFLVIGACIPASFAFASYDDDFDSWRSRRDNQAPVWEYDHDRVAYENEEIAFDIFARDTRDGNDDRLKYTAVTLPEGASFDVKREKFTWTPSHKQLGFNLVQLRVSDGLIDVYNSFFIQVLPRAGTVVSKPVNTTPVYTPYVPATKSEPAVNSSKPVNAGAVAGVSTNYPGLPNTGLGDIYKESIKGISSNNLLFPLGIITLFSLLGFYSISIRGLERFFAGVTLVLVVGGICLGVVYLFMVFRAEGVSPKILASSISTEVEFNVHRGDLGETLVYAPDRVVIPSLGVDANVQVVGVTVSGNMGTPTGENKYNDVAWYKDGAKPGEEGRAVIAGHLDNGFGSSAVFANLDKLKKGDLIVVLSKDGSSSVFNVFDTLNEVNVFNDTGRAGTTGDKIVAARTNPAELVNSLDQWFTIPTHYGEPRRIEMGLTYSF